MTNKFPRVLISAPTAAAKNYCFEEWLENVLSFNYPNFQVRLFDNTEDGGANADYLNQIYAERYGDTSDDPKFKAYNSLVLHKYKNPSVIARMALSHNDCRGYAIHNKFDYLLHLESDVFPEKNVIESLMFNRKRVVGAMFYRDEGKDRTLMAQRRIYCTPFNIKMVNFTAGEDLAICDGNLHEVASVGLGCVLIDVRSVFDLISFRYIPDVDMHPDSYFSEDCFLNKIPIFLDTKCVARHDNRPWGIFGVDFK